MNGIRSLTKLNSTQLFHTSKRLFYEQTRTGSLEYEQKKFKKLYPTEKDRIIDSVKSTNDELRWAWKRFKTDVVGMFRSDTKNFVFDDQEIVKVWDFDQRNNGKVSSLYLDYKRDKLNDMNNFQVSCDSDYELGYSKCSWTVSPSGRALFSGYIDKTLPKDGKTIATGYAYLGSYKSRGPFFTDESISEFRDFTHFVARVRGDGKRYFVVLDTSENMHHTWFSRYKFMLYTHGGPYWQYVKIPLSRFFFEYFGYVQDEQYILQPFKIRSVGILTTDNFPGDFSLEIDYLGFMTDSQWNDTIEYEGYYHESAVWKSVGSI